MARSSKGRKLIELLPAKRILTETDGPFVYSDQTQLENLKITINILSDILNTKPHETKSQIINNLRNILSRTQEGSIASGA
jgi:TatD DNase family protein